jgi:acetoin utilization deacetylase AcuC-like enzyme
MMKTFYRPEMVLMHCRDPGPRKAHDVMARVEPDREVSFRAATTSELCLVHSPDYVRGVLAGTLATGYGVPSSEVANQAAWVAGAMLAATEYVLKQKPGFACVPASGFHHAHYERGSGFCTFNSLVLAVGRACELGAKRILILDGDGHFGDGTEALLHHWQLRGRVRHVTDQGRRWRETFTDALGAGGWDLILYQAGADAHKDDPYGAGYLSDEEWVERDRLVFESARHARSPLIWCFAGGYAGEKTVRLHTSTFRTASEIFNWPAPAVL